MKNLLAGIYRGTVIDTNDSQNKGRLCVSVHAAAGATGWALPCAAYDRSNTVAKPPVGASVWVMFENGDAGHPVWMGWCPT